MMKQINLSDLGCNSTKNHKKVDVDICPFCNLEPCIENMEYHISVAHPQEYEPMLTEAKMDEIKRTSSLKKMLWLATLQWDRYKYDIQSYSNLREKQIEKYLISIGN